MKRKRRPTKKKQQKKKVISEESESSSESSSEEPKIVLEEPEKKKRKIEAPAPTQEGENQMSFEVPFFLRGKSGKRSKKLRLYNQIARNKDLDPKKLLSKKEQTEFRVVEKGTRMKKRHAVDKVIGVILSTQTSSELRQKNNWKVTENPFDKVYYTVLVINVDYALQDIRKNKREVEIKRVIDEQDVNRVGFMLQYIRFDNKKPTYLNSLDIPEDYRISSIIPGTIVRFGVAKTRFTPIEGSYVFVDGLYYSANKNEQGEIVGFSYKASSVSDLYQNTGFLKGNVTDFIKDSFMDFSKFMATKDFKLEQEDETSEMDFSRDIPQNTDGDVQMLDDEVPKKRKKYKKSDLYVLMTDDCMQDYMIQMKKQGKGGGYKPNKSYVFSITKAKKEKNGESRMLGLYIQCEVFKGTEKMVIPIRASGWSTVYKKGASATLDTFGITNLDAFDTIFSYGSTDRDSDVDPTPPMIIIASPKTSKNVDGVNTGFSSYEGNQQYGQITSSNSYEMTIKAVIPDMRKYIVDSGFGIPITPIEAIMALTRYKQLEHSNFEEAVGHAEQELNNIKAGRFVNLSPDDMGNKKNMMNLKLYGFDSMKKGDIFNLSEFIGEVSKQMKNVMKGIAKLYLLASHQAMTTEEFIYKIKADEDNVDEMKINTPEEVNQQLLRKALSGFADKRKTGIEKMGWTFLVFIIYVADE